MIFTPPWIRGGVIFLLQFVRLCVCMSVFEENADRTATPIVMQSLLNSCLLQTLEPYWNGDLGSKVKVTVKMKMKIALY